MSRRFMRNGVAVLGLALTAASVASCPSDGADGPLLIARAAAVQPGEDSSGVTLVIQAFGGDRLALRTEKGVHAFESSADRRQASCVSLEPGSLTLLQLQVFPTDEEPLVFVDLRKGDGSLDAGLDDACAGKTLRTLVVALGSAALPPDAGEEGEVVDAR